MQQVTVHTSSIIIPTYKIGSEDSEPALIREFTPRCDPIYPYTTQEKLSHEKVNQQYEAVILENKFLKLTFLPELNGRLYSAYDKINDAEIFYANPVIKPGLFALRGAWPAVGVEFNFPNSHTTTTLERVLCKTQTYDDGSASVIVGDIENTCRMAWCVEIKLTPDSARIEMESKLYNVTDYPQRYYYWINAACPLYKETQFIYPPSTRRLYTHPPMDASRLGYLDYPVHDGTDISMFKNINQHFPIFAENMLEDFYGIYHHNLDYGLVHVADHSLVRGRKLWMFGNARDGKIFIDLLSDDSKDYCELQTGPFSLQSDYRMLKPGKMYVQKDYWFPIAETGGFNVASKAFAANVEIIDHTAKILLYPNESMADLTVRAVDDDDIVAEEKMSLHAGHKICFKLPAGRRIKFVSHAGQVLAEYAVQHNDHISKTSMPIEDDSFLKGNYLEEQGYRDRAAEIYASAPESDIQCKTAQARLALECSKNALAFSLLENILKTDRNNPEALLYYGRLKRNQNDYVAAEKAFSRAADTAFRSDAILELAKCAVLNQDFQRAQNILFETVSNGAHAQHLALYALCLRKTGANPDKILRHAEKMFCFSPLVLGELFFLEQDNVELKHNPQIVLEIACSYAELGIFADALYILERIENNLPICEYYRAWLHKQLGNHEKAAMYLEVASASTWKTNFVFRNESERILNYALQENPGDFNALYHLGCFLACKDRITEAMELWKKVQGVHHSNALRNCGLYFWKKLDNKNQAINYYQQVISKNDVGAKTLIEAEALFEECGMNNKRLDIFSGCDALIEKDSRVKLALVKANLANGNAEQAWKLLTNGNFCLCEGKMLSRRLYEQTCSVLAESALHSSDFEGAANKFLDAAIYPENIGIGKPSGNKEAEWFFKAGIAFEQAGKPEAATDCFKHGVEKGEFLDIDFFPLKNVLWEADWEKIDLQYWTNAVYRIKCIKKLGRHIEAEKLYPKISDYITSLHKTGRGQSCECRKLEELFYNLKVG